MVDSHLRALAEAAKAARAAYEAYKATYSPSGEFDFVESDRLGRAWDVASKEFREAANEDAILDLLADRERGAAIEAAARVVYDEEVDLAATMRCEPMRHIVALGEALGPTLSEPAAHDR